MSCRAPIWGPGSLRFRLQSYLFFYDHLSKANWFLEQVIDLADEKLDSRRMQYLMSEMPAQDGGESRFYFRFSIAPYAG